MDNEVSPEKPPVTQIRLLHTLHTDPKGDTASELVSWSSSLQFKPDEQAAIQAFMELVSRICTVEPGEAVCIQDSERGGYAEARVDGHGMAAGSFSFVQYDEFVGGELRTDFSIGPGKALQLHIGTDGTVQLVAQSRVVPQPALNALGDALEDILLHQNGTETGNSNGNNVNTNNDRTAAAIAWTQPSVLNWPPRQTAVELWPREQAEQTPALLHSWFEQRACESPDRIALDFLTDLETGATTQFTYGQVSNAANALAAKLQHLAAASNARNVSDGLKIVAVAMGPSPELYISYLAALKAGLAFCPLPVDAPKERRAALLADLQPVAVLVEERTSVEQQDIASTTVNVNPFLAACDTATASPASLQATSDSDTAYVLYTSGTTGLPKGVIVSHRSATCTVSALSQHYGFSPDAQRPWRWFQGAAPTFDISLFEIFWTLSTGSTLCCAPRHLTMQNIDSVLSVLQADITNVTPSFASLISPSSLRGLMVGGETLNTRLVQDFSANGEATGNDRLPHGIYNGYGPTEVAIYSLAQPHIPVNQRGSIIGSPLATCGVLIIEPDSDNGELIPVPQGAVGELVLTGPQVSIRGYLNRPEETHKAFVDDAKWGRAYRTGDRASIVWNEKGEPVVEFLGRLSDEQVKLSGRRVELGEIEDVLASRAHGVQQTLACVWKEQGNAVNLGSERVVSLVVADAKSSLDFETVHASCVEAARQHLPDYMRPFRILQVNELPRSASGKTNRKAAAEYVHKILRQLSADADASKSGPVLDPALQNAEDTRLEAELVRILSAILGISEDTPALTATTRLADVGVDSLRAMRLLREIRNSTNDSVRIIQNRNLEPSLAMLLDPEASIRSVFFASATVKSSMQEKQAAARQLVDYFAARHTPAVLERLAATHGSLSDIDVEIVLPLTSTASQLAVSFAMDANNYISHTVLPLQPDVLASGLEMAIRTVMERHAVYRSALVPCSDDLSPFAQVVLTPAAWQKWIAKKPQIVRKTGPTSTNETQQWLDVAHKHLDFDSQQLYYVQLVEPENSQTGNNSLLIISMAHCLCDGASIELLLADIAREYAGQEPLDRLSMLDPVLDWAANVDPETDKHWRESVKEWEADNFHALSGKNVKPEHKYQHALATFTSKSLSWLALDTKSRALRASPLSILQAAWSLLLKVWSEANTEDIVFGSVVSSQNKACHAPTFSVVPCRVPLPQDQTVQTLLTSLVDRARFAQSHRHMSFGVFGTLPYNTALALQAYESTESSKEPGAAVPWMDVLQPEIRYDFDVFAEVIPHAEKLLYKITYRADALSEISASIIARQFSALVETLLASQLSDGAQHLLAQLPHELLSVEGTIPEPDALETYDRTKILHAQFEDQVAATPDKLALSFYSDLDAPPTNLTYAELDARANGLAHILRQEDAGVIPICMHRSVELYVSILAILKAGSAWSPIDETSPVQRRTSLIARTQGRVLLTTTDSYSLVEPCLGHESLAGVRVICVDEYADQITTERPPPRNSVVSPSSCITGKDLAYLLWTSGTTGEPKGVMIQHFAAANAMRDLQIRVEHDDEAIAGQVRTLQLSSYSFDVFVQDLFYTWGLAGSVISGTREIVLGTFTEFVKTARPTHAHLTPSFGASIDVRELHGSTLRYVTFIGEKLTEDVAESWAKPEITTKAYNTYGPAENAVVSTMRQFYGKSNDTSKAANVGFPLTPCTAYVVRESSSGRWELVPRYGVGELALGGAQVAHGYLNNEAKTTKSFVQGSAKVDGRITERIYLTGDMVRLNDHGFEFLGRNDDLVKITGIRIELSEISAACALVKEDEPALEHVETLYLPRPGSDTSNANNKVIATFVSVKDGNVDTNKLRQQVFQKAREVLPAYMVPGHVVVLDTTMPRTASNKVDRKALQAIYAAADLTVLAGGSGTSGDAPGEATAVKWRDEQLPIVQAVTDNMAVPQDPLRPMGPDDSLAGLGFSSLQITKLAWALRKQLVGCDVRVLDLMRCRVVGELVDVVLASMQKATVEEEANSSTTVVAVDSPATTWVSTLRDTLTRNLHGTSRPSSTIYVLPATPVQEALLVETMVEPGAYWSHRLFDLSSLGDIDLGRLQAAWKAAAAHLDVLRTVFVPIAQLSTKHTSQKISTAAWARSHGVHAAVLQFVLEKAEISWTQLAKSDDGDLAAHARKTQAELTPLGDGSSAPRPPWAVTYAPATKTLMLSMHHALYDGESSRMLLDAVARLYHNPEIDLKTNTDRADSRLLPLSRGLELGLLPSLAQRDEASAAWNKHINSLVEVDGAVNAPFPDLTGSRQPQVHAILSAKASIPAEFSEHADLPRLVLSAFGCVLAAILEVKTIVLGQTVSQRILHPDLAHVVGPAVATLPVAIRTHAASASALWAEMGRDASLLGALAHHLHPVDIKKMANEGSGDPHAPFPALFVYHPAGVEDKSTDSVGTRAFNEIGQALSLHVEHPMALNVFEGDSIIELTGDARRISQAMLDLVLAQILDQARAMLSHPDVPLAQLSNHMDLTLVSVTGEPKQLVGTVISRNPADLVTKQAREHPDWVAIEEVVFDEEDDDRIATTAVTYRELEELVNAISAQLTTSAAGKCTPGDVIAVYLERDIKSLAAIAAVFKLGYVYLPIDGDLPAARKQLLVRDADAKMVITTESLLGDLGLIQDDDAAVVVLLPEGQSELDIILSWKSAVSDSHVMGTAEQDTAGGYLLYTSGSTGRPKGVRVTNESLLHYVAAMTQRLAEANPDVTLANLGGEGKFLNVASRAFDTHLTTMFAPWHLGFCSVIGKDRNGIFANLAHVINTVGITNMGTVPSVLLQLGLRLEEVPSIRVMTFGGEKASHELFDQLGGNEKAALMNFYGPTEAAVGCMSHVVGHHSNARNLGLPLPGLEALLLVSGDGDEQIVARRGQPGELCIAGPQVAVGYLDRPDETAKSFQFTTLLGPDDSGPQKRIYRTGDMMRMMHDGTVEFLGRRDQQTKIRGQRFEIGEVEAHIKKSIANLGGAALDVAAAVVDQRLVGLVARKQVALLKVERDAPAELLIPPPGQACREILVAAEQACQKDLPAFMVPEMFWLSKMPFLAASGKLDTKQIMQIIREADNAGAEGNNRETSTATAVAPQRTGPEKEVIAALTEVLGDSVENRSVSASSNLRGLGIDSLSGVHLLAVLKRRGFANVVLTDLLSASGSIHSLSLKFTATSSIKDTPPSPPKTPPMTRDPSQSSNAMAKGIDELTLADLGASASHIDPANVAAILPCLPIQSSLVALSLNWLHNVEEDGGCNGRKVPYVTQFNYQLVSGAEVEAWRQAVEQVISSEAVLRTCFVQRDKDGQIFQVVLQSPPSPFVANDDANELVTNMDSRPPTQICVDGDHISLLIHHALYDGAAIVAIRKKIEQAYEFIKSGTSAPFPAHDSLPALRHLVQHCNLSQDNLQTVQAAWQAKLKDISPCHISPHPSQSDKHFARVTRRLAYSASELKTKLQLPPSLGWSISTATAFHTATVLVLASVVSDSSSSIIYGNTTSLRPLVPQSTNIANDMDSFIGPCLNTVVHALSLVDSSETLPSLASRVAQNHTDVSEGQMPFVTADRVQRWAGIDDKLFDSLLTINVVTGPANDTPTKGVMRSLPGKAELDLALTIDVDVHADGRIELLLASAGFLGEEQLEQAGRLFETVVENSANADATVGQYVSVSKSASVVPRETLGSSSVTDDISSNSKEDQAALASIRSLVCQLLNLTETNVPAETSLYRLGLDSINVLPFVKLLNKDQGIKVTPNAVLRARTLQGVASLASAAKTKVNKSLSQDVAPFTVVTAHGYNYDQTIKQVADSLLFVATPLQEGMLSVSMALAEGAYTYTHYMQLSVASLQQDAPDFKLFFAAFQDAVLACEILRTRFVFTNNSHAPWVGVVLPSTQSDLVSCIVSSSGILKLRIHHALYDASSISAVWRLLGEKYAGRLAGVQSQAKQTRLYLYHPFAKQVAVAQKFAVDYWVNTVKDYNYSALALGGDDGQQQHASASFHFSLDAADFTALHTTCRKASVALKTALQLAWTKVLCEALYQQSDMVFGEVITMSSDGDDDDATVMGPTINTVPMRVKLAQPSTTPITISDALLQLQGLGDQARGSRGMASLRDVQTAWRLSRADGVDTSAGLFQSLFVFDGDVTVKTESASTSPLLPFDVDGQLSSDSKQDSKSEQAPLYDDYPLIASFRIRDGVLHGALRAKVSNDEVHRLGSQLHSALQSLASGSLQDAALDPAVAAKFPPPLAGIAAIAGNSNSTKNTNVDVDMNGSTDLADSVMQLAKQVIGTRLRGKGNIVYSTKLINIGLDSISAIRFANLLKEELGIHVSVFDIIKGASVESIIQKHASASMQPKMKEAPSTEHTYEQPQQLIQDETLAKSLIAAKLSLSSTSEIKSVLPVLAGQRHTLQHWLNSGKRFFEAPWVFRIADGKTMSSEAVASIWKTLCFTHDILQTTFVALDNNSLPDLVQATLHAGSESTATRFTTVTDNTATIQNLIETFVRETNSTPSDLRTPPSHLSFFEATDGQAIVLRVHHALYDAWSIKMVLSDLRRLFDGEASPLARSSLQSAIQEMARVRTPQAEQAFWKEHLAHAKDTIISTTSSTDTTAVTAPLGPHFKASYPGIFNLQSIDSSASVNKTKTSVAILAAYAQALGHITGLTQPTFGINYAARSLSSADSEQTLELTDMSLPTMVVVPMSVALNTSTQQQLDAVRGHLAEMTKFAQSDNLHRLAASYNTHINILFAEDANNTQSNADSVLQRHRLGEPLGSEYFTTIEPVATATSTVDSMDISWLPREHLYFNVVVRNGSVSVNVSGDQDLVINGNDMVDRFVGSFKSALTEVMKE
ncbi:NRPS [Sporothrix bragantina]|uniref:NRPS n=1 Tax=Sporothrix bragantina TaxID=671064 RepID=A0ABP0CND0_9PEZI